MSSFTGREETAVGRGGRREKGMVSGSGSLDKRGYETGAGGETGLTLVTS